MCERQMNKAKKWAFTKKWKLKRPFYLSEVEIEWDKEMTKRMEKEDKLKKVK